MSVDLPKVPVLPTLVTLASGACGFTAILYCCTGQLEHASIAAWLILAALVLDGVDGRLARMTGRASDFGTELDSLCDLVAFGVAPAVLALSVMGALELLASPAPTASARLLGRLYWLLGAMYVACATVRLARFNVITSLDTEAHRHFTGLPSPAAAGLLASLVIAHAGLASPAAPQHGPLAQFVLPAAIVLSSVLMVSRARYAHLVYELSKSGRSLALVVELLFAGAIIVLLQEFALAVLFVAYVLSGLVGVALDRVLERLEPAGEGPSLP
ncbi:MAG: CDP-diacylglycerol--serine O-phosphatidyltransferase [Planctomycetes bacterium]|nr:CDP-diacylglycerol--serine O-phosphatidyltransferase [Planctomycetota bacterium]